MIGRIYQLPADRQRVPLFEAQGRVLAADVVALTDLPPFDRAAVDGFAVRKADLKEGTSTLLRLVGRAAAGHPFAGSVGAGEAVRILTGAPLADGADFIVMQEHCAQTDRAVVVQGRSQRRDNIRRRGEDCRTGSVVIEAGAHLSAGDIALTAGLGHREVLAFPRPRVALFSTGDELCEQGGAERDGQIADANRPLLCGMLRSYGCDVTDCGILPDEESAIITALVSAAGTHDLIVTSGGVSQGDEDHMSRVIRRRGCLETWRLKIKPGKPIGMGDIDDCPILALPGNPVAAAAGLTLIGRHIVARLSGALAPWPKQVRLPARFEHDKAKGHVECWPCRLWGDDEGRSIVDLMPNRGPAMLSSLAGADGFAILGEDVETVTPATLVDFVPLL
jgi:molybdopterin molybdotransferase